MTPECCKHCKWSGPDGGCLRSFKTCGKWRWWFHSQLKAIRQEGKRLKEERRAKR